MKIILTEEEYMERLGAILKRDFFPYLELEDEFSEPEMLSISQFQSIYTTEDNASFEDLLSRENERKRQKFERIYGGPPARVDDPSRRLLLKESALDEWKFKKVSGTLLIENGGSGKVDMDDSRKPAINIKNTRFNTEPSAATPSSTPNRFKIPPSPAREQLAHSLLTAQTSTAKTAKNKRKNTPKVPNYSMDDLKALTPRREKK